MRYYTPNGRAIQAAGILPDVVIEYESDAKEPFATLREESLAGHLAAEGQPAEQPRIVLKAKERPTLVPIAEIPEDPSKAADFALKTGYEELERGIRERKE